MLLSPDSPSLAAALVGTTDGEEVVAVAVLVPVDVDVAGMVAESSADDDGLLDAMVGVTVVLPEVMTVVLVQVQESVKVGDVEGSDPEVQLVFAAWVAVAETVLVTGSLAAAEVAALRAARRREERILEDPRESRNKQPTVQIGLDPLWSVKVEDKADRKGREGKGRRQKVKLRKEEVPPAGQPASQPVGDGSVVLLDGAGELEMELERAGGEQTKLG
ncbi:hypothetical protein VP1G_00612 [Cytospora mali]|uniref:Uncharacterized protein n=1 Tax=Cytospora mali TaxID=578113 RepID=A0A194UNN0_CYTMA|nr:hypothetical protein VP1G_00612 [Valsa mali var. pyri (nom. inval.)]